VAGLSTRNYRRAVESVVEGYGIEKSSVSRQFVAASSNQLRALCDVITNQNLEDWPQGPYSIVRTAFPSDRPNSWLATRGTGLQK
jgi:hypothetical protein